MVEINRREFLGLLAVFSAGAGVGYVTFGEELDELTGEGGTDRGKKLPTTFEMTTVTEFHVATSIAELPEPESIPAAGLTAAEGTVIWTTESERWVVTNAGSDDRPKASGNFDSLTLGGQSRSSWPSGSTETVDTMGFVGDYSSSTSGRPSSEFGNIEWKEHPQLAPLGSRWERSMELGEG